MHICRILSVFDSLWSAEGLEYTKNRLKIFMKTPLVVMKVCTSISSHVTLTGENCTLIWVFAMHVLISKPLMSRHSNDIPRNDK